MDLSTLEWRRPLYRFLCDEMLFGLGKWLRAAGYDTSLIAISIDDRFIIEHAVRENRLLLTRDKQFLTMDATEKTVVYLKGNSIEVCIHELTEKLKIDWLYRPFSRCLVCNTLLVESSEEDALMQVPPKVRTFVKDFVYCSSCKKVYWDGSHTKKMSEQLHVWQKKQKP